MFEMRWGEIANRQIKGKKNTFDNRVAVRAPLVLRIVRQAQSNAARFNIVGIVETLVRFENHLLPRIIEDHLKPTKYLAADKSVILIARPVAFGILR